MSREVIVARTAGFCFGVERAVDQVYEQIGLVEQGRASGPIYTYGPIIHNEEVVRDLSDKGVMVLETEEELPWSLDGEYAPSVPVVDIVNRQRALRMLL